MSFAGDNHYLCLFRCGSGHYPLQDLQMRTSLTIFALFDTFDNQTVAYAYDHIRRVVSSAHKGCAWTQQFERGSMAQCEARKLPGGRCRAGICRL